LDTIKEADISYIKKLGNPPGAIKLVRDGLVVCYEKQVGGSHVAARSKAIEPLLYKRSCSSWELQSW
jgi:hypothetical protein